MSTIIKLPVARDQRASRNRRKFHYTRGNSKFIGHRISRSRSSRGITESDFDWKKKVVIYLRDRIGEWVDSDIIEASFNPIRIYDFYGISLWMQLIAGGIKPSFMDRITDSRGHEGKHPSNFRILIVPFEPTAFRWCARNSSPFCPFHSLNNCIPVTRFVDKKNDKE